jgi:hypothetical protein
VTLRARVANLGVLAIAGMIGGAAVAAAAPPVHMVIPSATVAAKVLAPVAHVAHADGPPLIAHLDPAQPPVDPAQPPAAPPPSPMEQIEGILDTMSVEFNIDHCLIWAVAWHESRWNPQAVGDNGTSFGLFQLHVGGELGNLTPQEVMAEPALNAFIAVSRLAAVIQANPGISPGWAAALAQRPADPVLYAQRITSWWSACHAGWNPATS